MRSVSIVSAANSRREPIASGPSKTHPIGVRRRMHSVTARLPKRAIMGDDVAFVVNTLGNIFFDALELTRRSRWPLRTRLGGNPLQLVELALQPQQLTLLDLRPALGLVS